MILLTSQGLHWHTCLASSRGEAAGNEHKDQKLTGAKFYPSRYLLYRALEALVPYIVGTRGLGKAQPILVVGLRPDGMRNGFLNDSTDVRKASWDGA